MHDLWLRLRAIFFKNRVEQDLDDELEFHIEMQKRKNIQAGMPEAEALRKARLQFGRDSAVKEECRDAQRIRPIETLRQDVAYALRGFRRTPTFALTVILTIGLGLGANTAIFTIFNAYVLRPLAVSNPESLYQLSWVNQKGKMHAFTWQQYQQLQASANPSFSEVHAVRGMSVRVNGRQSYAEFVTGNYFRMLGVDAQLGRALTPEDTATPGREPVVVLSAAAWRSQFAGDPNIVGKKILMRGFPLEVVGVARDGFTGLGDVQRDYWLPLTLYGQLNPGSDLFGNSSPEVLTAIVRLKHGVTEYQARALLPSWIGRITQDLPEAERAVGGTIVSRATSVYLSPNALTVLLPLFAAFALVLLIACANVANMMLARAMARQREIGIRRSLGAARARLVRQLLTESIVLALPGAAAGFLIFGFLVRGRCAPLMYATLPSDFAEFVRVAPLDPDFRVFGFMMIAAIVSGVVFGLAPALQATKASVVQAARGDFGHEYRPQRLRNTLVIFQIAVSLMLLVCSGILLRSANRISGLDTGLRTHGVVCMYLLETKRDQVIAQLAHEPQIRILGAASHVPLDSGFPSAKVVASEGKSLDSSYDFVSPEFFEVFDVKLSRGRNFTMDESLTGAPVAIISETVANMLWPGRDAIGQSLQFSQDVSSYPTRVWESPAKLTSLGHPSAQVIGVARDVNTGFLDNQSSRSLIYFPTNPRVAGRAIVARVDGDPEAARRNIDKSLAYSLPGGMDQIHRMEGLVEGRSYPFRVAYWISALLGTLALLLTISGIYGVISYLVEQRLREMGIRMALGATGRSVVALVLKQSVRLAAIGIAIGGVLALGVSRLLAAVLVNSDTFDKTAYSAAILAVFAACLAAAFVPSLLAARVDPVNTLRHD